MRKYVLLAITGLVFVGCTMEQAKHWEAFSPDKNIKLSIFLNEGQLYYQVYAADHIVIDTSRLGVVRNDTDLSVKLVLIEANQPEEFTNDFAMITGKSRQVKSTGISRSFSFENEKGSELIVECKVYNDGLALRYLFPGEAGDPITVQKDLMEFNFSSGGNVWIQPYDQVTKWTPAYERYYENAINLGAVGEHGNGWGFPTLINTNDHWVLLSEGGIDGNYAGSHLDNEAGSSVYKLRWPEESEALGMDASLPSGTLPWQSSWKTMAIGDLETIVKSKLVDQVSPPNRLTNISWIKPGRASWSWLSDHDSPRDYAKLIDFIDLAVEMSWEYSLVDANWGKMTGGDIKQLVEYANRKEIGILIWYNSGGPHNKVTEGPRNIMNDPELRQKEFAKLKEWGVRGVKVDFFQSDKQFMMQLYKDILEDAAASEIMVNFHGCAIPRGWARTYPNLITMESVRGAECYTFASEYPEEAPTLNTILPFTRNVIGSMDYTPVIFTDMQYPHITTCGHEMALSVVFESGWLHFGDGVEGYQSLGEQAKSFLMEIPVVWDEVRLLHGYPGKDVVLARRNGKDWYIGGINGEDQAKTWELDLSFLEDDYNMLKITDGETPREMISAIEKAPSTITIEVLPYGGFTLELKPK